MIERAHTWDWLARAPAPKPRQMAWNERRLPGPQLSRQPDYSGGAELAAEVLTEPTELARGEAHRP